MGDKGIPPHGLGVGSATYKTASDNRDIMSQGGKEEARIKVNATDSSTQILTPSLPPFLPTPFPHPIPT